MIALLVYFVKGLYFIHCAVREKINLTYFREVISDDRALALLTPILKLSLEFQFESLKSDEHSLNDSF